MKLYIKPFRSAFCWYLRPRPMKWQGHHLSNSSLLWALLYTIKILFFSHANLLFMHRVLPAFLCCPLVWTCELGKNILVGYRSAFASVAPFLSGPSLGVNQRVNVYMLPLDLCDRDSFPINNLFLITSSMQIMMGYELRWRDDEIGLSFFRFFGWLTCSKMWY